MANNLKAKVRKMYREIPMVTDVLDKHELKLSTVKGKGMKILGSEERFYIILMKLLHQNVEEIQQKLGDRFRKYLRKNI